MDLVIDSQPCITDMQVGCISSPGHCFFRCQIGSLYCVSRFSTLIIDGAFCFAFFSVGGLFSSIISDPESSQRDYAVDICKLSRSAQPIFTFAPRIPITMVVDMMLPIVAPTY